LAGEVNRPDFKSYKYAADPRRAYSDAMKNYLVHLEENQVTSTYQQLRYLHDEHLRNFHEKLEENRNLRKTLKTMRSQIKFIYKEHHGYKASTM
jgi:hypothetical protein